MPVLDPQLIFILILIVPLETAFFIWVILKAATYRPPTMLVIVIAVIALICLTGYLIVGKDRGDLIAIGSACVGALTTMLTKVGSKLDPEPPPKQEDPDGDSSQELGDR